MRKTTFFLTALTALFSPSIAEAKEGMWLPFLLQNYGDMQSMGLQLTKEEIYDVNQASLKDAVVSFGGFCTGELISNQGLVLTNHHCGYRAIQSHSSVTNDLLKDGFWAKSKAEELQNPDLYVAFMVSMEDVTNSLLKDMPQNLGAKERREYLGKKAAEMAKSAVPDGAGYEAEVVEFSYGNQYILIISRNYNDVRLVGAPPSSIGKYGSDTDNWVWPRHTGDFSLFRVYANSNNLPAAPSAENRPYVPKKHLEIALKGIQSGDFTMVMGFPGRTEEYLPSAAVEQVINSTNPIRVGAREIRLDVLDKYMRQDDATRIKYAASYASVANGWKKWMGESLGLRFSRAVEKKKEEESRLRALITSNPKWKEQYEGVIDSLNQLVQRMEPLEATSGLFIEAIWQGFAIRPLWNYYRGYEGKPVEFPKEFGDRVTGYIQSYDRAIDKETLRRLVPFYVQHMGEKLPTSWKKALQACGSAENMVDQWFEESLLVSTKGLAKQMDWAKSNPQKLLKKIAKDPVYMAMKQALDAYLADVAALEPLEEKHLEAMRLHVASIAETGIYGTFYPDANSTLRVSYGRAEGMNPRDGVTYVPTTTLDGVVAKYIPGDYEFDLPQKVLELHASKTYGRYANENGNLPVCFLGSNHTTGGNSGSPALNAKGQLVGLNFDRTWEGTMSDINYDLALCRNIMVDIRYVLWTIEYVGECKYLVDEMSIVQ